MNTATRLLLKRLLAIWVLLVLSALGAFAWMAHLAQRQSFAHLASAARVEQALQSRQLTELRLRADHLAQDPAFVDYVAQSLIPDPAMNNRVDSTSITDLLDSRRKGYDLALVLDANGKQAARSGTLLANDAQIRNDPAIGQVIATLKPRQEVRVEQGKIMLVAVEPLLRGGALQGVLYTATELGNGFAQAIGKVADTGIALVPSPARASETPPNSGLPPTLLEAIGAKLSATPASASATVALQLDAAGAAPALATPMDTVGDRATLVALDPDFSTASATVASVWPLWVGITVLGVAATLAAWLRWRRHDVPLDRICDILVRGVQGDHKLVIRTQGSPALCRLRDEVNALLEVSGRNKA